jgi:hypothetical protein
MIRHERTPTAVPKNIPKSRMLRMRSPTSSHERQEDIGPLGQQPPKIAPAFFRNIIAADKEIVGHMACLAGHAIERHEPRFDTLAVTMQHHRAAAGQGALRGKCASVESLLAVGFVDHADIGAWQIAQRVDTRPCLGKTRFQRFLNLDAEISARQLQIAMGVALDRLARQRPRREAGRPRPAFPRTSRRCSGLGARKRHRPHRGIGQPRTAFPACRSDSEHRQAIAASLRRRRGSRHGGP